MANIKITTEELQPHIEKIGELKEDINNHMSDVFEEIKKFALNENTYEPLWTLRNKLYEKYEDQLEILNKQVENWEDSEASLVAHAEDYQMGDKAKQTAQTLQTRVVDTIKEINLSKIVDVENPDFSESRYEEKTWENFLDKLVKFKDISESIQYVENELTDACEDNLAVNCFVQVVSIINGAVMSFLDFLESEFNEFKNEKMETVETKFEENVEKAAEEIKNQLTELENLGTVVDEIFDFK